MISICMIGKNEESTLRKCLSALKPLEYEIIFVDTGSTDLTKSIALEFTPHVYDFTWCNDFSAARNYSISKASNDYVLIVDCDEFLESFDKVMLEKELTRNPKFVGRITRINPYMQNGQSLEMYERINRLFSRKYYHYSGIIHEQVTANDGNDYNTYHVPLTVKHCGYNGSENEKRKKAKRNISLLKTALLQTPNDCYIRYQLGKSYDMLGDFEQAYQTFHEALYFDLDPKLEYVQDMIESYGYSMLHTNRAKEALSYENIYDEFCHCADFKFLMGLIYMNNAMYNQAIEEFQKATKTPYFKVKGVNSFLAHYNIGVIYECLGNISMAKIYYAKCNDYKPAINRIKKLESNHS